MKQLILTCDAGTTACKCSVFNTDGIAIAAVRKPYKTYFPKPNWSEQHPEEVGAAVLEAIRELLTQVKAEDIACIGLSGTMNGCIPVDCEGRPLYSNIIHSDSRADKEAAEIGNAISGEDFYKLTGNKLDNHYTLPKILWLKKHEPDVYKRARRFLNTKDYIYGLLTGCYGYTDYSDASLTIALDINKKQWAFDLLKDIGVDGSCMPDIIAGHDVSRSVCKETARRTGLIEGTPVAMGGGDGACAARGAGVHQPGSAYCSIGSSAWVSQLTDTPVFDPGQRLFGYVDMDGQMYHLCGTTQCGGEAYDWAVKELIGGAGEDKKQAVKEAEDMARSIVPGAEGVFFLPTLMGERTPYWDPNTKGVLAGFSLYHNRAHIARAVYEGVAFALNTGAEVMKECGVPVTSLMLTGGGALSGLWPDIFASVFGVETRVHRFPSEACSMGAAIAAGVGVGLFKDYHEAAKMADAKATYAVNPEWQKAYKKLFEVYSGIYYGMKPTFDKIAALEK